MLYEGRNDDRSSYVRVEASPATRSNGTCRLVQHHGVADGVDPPPARPPRQLRVLARA